MDRATKLALNILSLTMFSVGAAMFVAIGTLPDIETDLGVSRSQVGLVVAVYAFGAAIGAPVLQVLIGHLPRKQLVVAGLGIMGGGMVLSGLAPSFTWVLVGRVIAALGGSVASPLASALGASLVAGPRQGQALAVVFGGMTLASATIAPLATWLGANIGWRPTFVSFGVMMIAFAALTAARVPETGGGRKLRFRDLGTMLINPVTFSGLLVPVVALAGLFSTFTLITLIYFERIGASPTATAIAMALYGAAGVGGNLFSRRVTGFWPAERAMIVALIVIISALVALFLLPPLIVPATACIILWSAALSTFFPAQQGRLIGFEPARAGVILALNTSAMYVGMSFGSSIAGYIEGHFGLGPLPLASAVLVACAFGVLLVSMRIARLRGVPDGTI